MKSVSAIGRFSNLYSLSVNSCCSKIPLRLQVRDSASGHSSSTRCLPLVCTVRHLGLGSTGKDIDEAASGPRAGPLTKAHAAELILHLTDDERILLLTAMEEYHSNKIKEEFEDKLAAQRWRSKLGRPSKVPTLGDVDPTGTYCPVPEDWLKKKYAATVPKPTSTELFRLSFTNSVPFIGFGFLDNCIMIIAGDSIESSMSAYITLSTMAAAALGNTFSDVIGIGSSLYVERGAARLGLRPPPLTPVQLDMPVSRHFANMGRVIGITIGCFLGMTPLLFIDSDKDDKKENIVKPDK